MTIINKLASTLNRKDEVPNQKLAKEIAETENREAVAELMVNLTNNIKAIQNDCIKVLYELGAIKPDLIGDHLDDFLVLLDHKNNRLQWGAMAAISCISAIRSKDVYKNLPKIIDTANKGSVITRDHAINILVNVAAEPRYAKSAFDLLTEQLLKSPSNQLPMYAERVLPIINNQNKSDFIRVLHSRLDDIEKESKQKRIKKVIRKLIE